MQREFVAGGYLPHRSGAESLMAPKSAIPASVARPVSVAVKGAGEHWRSREFDEH